MRIRIHLNPRDLPLNTWVNTGRGGVTDTPDRHAPWHSAGVIHQFYGADPIECDN